MKWKNNRIWIVVAVLAVLTILTLLFRNGDKRWDWRQTYRFDSKDPYGAFVIAELLGTYYPEYPLTILKDSLALPVVGDFRTANYVFIGEGMYIDSLETQKLLDFVGQGNRAFISSRTIPDRLADSIMVIDYCDDYLYWYDYPDLIDSIARFRLVHPRLNDSLIYDYRFRYRDRLQMYRWQYIDSSFFCAPENRPEVMGYMNGDLINFARIPYGNGYFFLHTAPIAFSNIHMIEPAPLEYAERVFSHLHEGPIFWDEHLKVTEELARRQNRGGDMPPPERRLDAQSPLQYVLAQPALTWAWYLLLATGLLYLVFRGKRRQRIVPVLETNKNTSLEFLSTIGRLYYQQNDHKGLALQQMKLFKASVHQFYGLKTLELDRDFVEKLAGKSEIPVETIEELLEQFRQIERSPQISGDQLIEFHRRLDFFYKNRK